MAPTISLSQVQGMIGNVPQVVAQAQQIAVPSAGASKGSAIAAQLRHIGSNKKTDKFFREVVNQDEDNDMTYQQFIKKAARANVINNPRIAAYAEILKEKHTFNVAKEVTEEERRLRKQDDEDKLQQAKARSVEQNLVRDSLIDQLGLSDGSISMETITDLSRPGRVMQLVSSAEKTMLGKDNALPSTERANLVKEITDQLKLAADIELTKQQEEGATDRATLAVDAREKAAENRATSIPKSAYSEDTARANRSLTILYTRLQVATKAKDKTTIDKVTPQVMEAEIDLEAKRRAEQQAGENDLTLTRQKLLYNTAVQAVRAEKITRYLDMLNTDPKRINKEFKTGFDCGGEGNEEAKLKELISSLGGTIEYDEKTKQYTVPESITNAPTSPAGTAAPTKAPGDGINLGGANKVKSVDDILDQFVPDPVSLSAGIQ